MSLRRKIRRRGQTPDGYLQIVYTPLPQAAHAALSAEFREQASRLHARVHEEPDAAVTELRAWIAREPNPMLFSWLGMALGMLGDEKAVEETVRENYRRNPTYLFARLNLARAVPAQRGPAGAREALGKSLDIRAAPGAGGASTFPRARATSTWSACATSSREIATRRNRGTRCWRRWCPVNPGRRRWGTTCGRARGMGSPGPPGDGRLREPAGRRRIWRPTRAGRVSCCRCIIRPNMRATIIASVDVPGEREAVEAWFARWRPRLSYCSENTGCGCCVDMWDVEGPDPAIQALPPGVRAMSDWTDPPRSEKAPKGAVRKKGKKPPRPRR